MSSIRATLLGVAAANLFQAATELGRITEIEGRGNNASKDQLKELDEADIVELIDGLDEAILVYAETRNSYACDGQVAVPQLMIGLGDSEADGIGTGTGL